MTDASALKPRPQLVDVTQLTKKERSARAAAAAAADAAARIVKPSEAPTLLLRLMARDCRKQLEDLLDEACSGNFDLRENARLLLTVARTLDKVEAELVGRKPDEPI